MELKTLTVTIRRFKCALCNKNYTVSYNGPVDISARIDGVLQDVCYVCCPMAYKNVNVTDPKNVWTERAQEAPKPKVAPGEGIEVSVEEWEKYKKLVRHPLVKFLKGVGLI